MSENTNNYEEPIEFDEVYEAKGIRIARKGRLTYVDNIMSPEDRKEFLNSIDERKKALSDEIEKEVRELEEIICQFNPFDILGNIKYRNAIIDAEGYKEYSHDGNDAFTEYLALVFLTKSFDSYPELTAPFSGEIIEDIQTRIKNLFIATVLFFGIMDITPDEDEGGKNDALDMLRFNTLVRSLQVRYMYYIHHKKEYLALLFEPLQGELENLLGFNIDDAIRIAEVIGEYEVKKLLDRNEKARQYAKDLRKSVKAYRRKRKLIGELPEDIIKDLAKLKPSESAKRINGVASLWTFWGLDKLFLFTPDEISNESGLSSEIVSNYLNHMSLEFGSVDEFFRPPRPTHPLMIKSLVRVEDRFYSPVYQLQFSNLQPAIESFINPSGEYSLVPDNTTWDRYIQLRGKFLENQAIALLGDALNSQQVFRNLSYTIKENGEEGLTELDGLIIHDTTLFLIEAKAGSVTPSARRGGPLRIQRDLQGLVNDAFHQCLRARKFISDNDIAIFTLPDGTKIEINKEDYRQIFMVNVTLDTLDAFVTNTYYLQELGLLKEDEYLWSLPLADLRVICEMIEFPTQLIHYLQRRLRVNDFHFLSTFDELDWFGNYLLEGLYFEDEAEDAENININLGSYTTMFDDYYLYESGLRKTPTEKPRQEMPELLRTIIHELESTKPSGYSEAICKLLEGDSETREKFIEGIQNVKQMVLEDRQSHDISICFSKPSFGVTYMSGPLEESDELRERLFGYCIFKKYQTKSDFWVGFASVAQSSNWASLGIILNDPWEYNSESEEMKKMTEESLGITPVDVE